MGAWRTHLSKGALADDAEQLKVMQPDTCGWCLQGPWACTWAAQRMDKGACRDGVVLLHLELRIVQDLLVLLLLFQAKD